MSKLKKGEYLKRQDRDKTVYYYCDEKIGVDRKVREIYKNKEVHFPFSPKNGRRKYRKIKEICYENISNFRSLPPGFLKSPKTGYGFTRELIPILYKLEDEYSDVNRLVVTNKRPPQILKRTIVLTYELLERARKQIKTMQSKHKDESEVIVNNLLHDIFPNCFKKLTKRYPEGEISRLFSKYIITCANLTEEEVSILSNLFSNTLKSRPTQNKKKIVATKRQVDYIYLDKILEEFNKIFTQKTPSRKLEARWQKFFKDNILYFNFGYVERFEKVKVFGDKKINYPDFILLDTYGFLDIYEIKTHLTQILSYDDGRNNFYWHAEIAKAISQAENYIDAIMKREDEVIKDIRDEYGINVDAVRPSVYIIAGSRNILAGKQTSTFSHSKKAKMKSDFRRLNNSLKNIKIFTYDDLRETFNNMLKKLEG